MKALIVDDEPMPAKHLKGMIEEHCFEVTSIAIINSPYTALEHLGQHDYDLLFLDVEMPGMNGFELIEQARLPAATHVIFTTAYSQYAVDAFKVNAVHYLLKPVERDELITAIRKANAALGHQVPQAEPPSEPKERITIFHNNEHHILQTKSILRLEAEGSYTRIVLADQQIVSSKGLGYFVKRLPTETFFRCHNSHLINLNHLIKIGKGRPGYVVLSNQDIVPVAQSKKEEIERQIGL